MQANGFLYHQADAPGTPWAWFVGASFLLHVILFAVILFFPHTSASRHSAADHRVIEVDLAAINPRPPSASAPETARKPEKAQAGDYAPKARAPEKSPEAAPQEQAVEVKKAPQKQFDPSDYVVEKPRQKVKQSMKKKTIRTAAVRRSAVEKLREKSKASRPRSVSERINAMKSEVSGQDRKLSNKSAGRSGRSGGGSAARDMSRMEVYQAEVAVEMKNNWVFSESLAGGDARGLESRLVIKIMPDGSITDVWYAKRSGNTYLDQSAYRTVKKSDPLPPLPEGYPYYHLMLGFTPSGLSR